MSDEEFVKRFMLGVVEVAGMNPIGPPHLDLYSGPHHEWDGYSATVHIQTSHVTAHFFAFGYVFIDLFSCRPFDRRRTKAFITKALRPRRPMWRELGRGANFPRELIDPQQVRAAQVGAAVAG